MGGDRSIESGKGVLWPATITVTSRALSVTGDVKPGSSGRIGQFSEGGGARRRNTSPSVIMQRCQTSFTSINLQLHKLHSLSFLINISMQFE